MKLYREDLSDKIIMAKVLRSLTPKFDHVVVAIEESHDLSDYFFDELMSSLQAHEERLNKAQDKGEEKAFQVKKEADKFENSGGRGRGRSGFHGRGHGERKGRERSTDQRQIKSNIQCYYRKKISHKRIDCWLKQKDDYKHDEQKHVHFIKKTEVESKLFMTHSSSNYSFGDVWFIDSGCSNHMTGTKSLFKMLDKSHKTEVPLGDNNQIQVEGKVQLQLKQLGVM